ELPTAIFPSHNEQGMNKRRACGFHDYSDTLRQAATQDLSLSLTSFLEAKRSSWRVYDNKSLPL
ncbi:hypothetical protein, partial [Pseudomonas helleri]|uniref:hypothetical protein n=1 Tax=Pseudomonas helleri TaxID=1608996 RepID=UPI001E610460